MTKQSDKPEVIAFYLPQYHPTKENDEWYGKGFTEWTNVGKAKPLFKGHYQPIVPADLGYYDLRLPEIRQQQAVLAKEAGISAFCYYHYWFGKGKQLLERPFQEMVQAKDTDMPFCLCWANHIWYKKTWNASSNVLEHETLMDIDYGDKADWKLHFDILLPAFKDKRYYKAEGKLVFVLYRPADIPSLKEFMQYWNELASENNLPEFLFMAYMDDITKMKDPVYDLFEKKIISCKSNIESVGGSPFVRKLSRFSKELVSQVFHLPLGVYNYKKIRKKLISPSFSEEAVIPTLIPNWDNTARRGMGATVLHKATPEQFYLHCKETFQLIRNKQNKLVFLKSWNEWGEGNYMEPCLKYGHGYIKALNQAINECSTK